jgi:hypothetical protein
MKIICKTLFDCTYTGVTGNFRPGQIPFRDRAGQAIEEIADWNKSRNQQRNWETILQLISLNTQPQDIVLPQCNNGTWQFEFRVESADVFAANNSTDPLAGLKQNCTGVPMIVNLNETSTIEPVLSASGSQQNIWFETINIGLE